ncbi:unnamed protein product [Owenia fusiformis]|uniref:Ig-like domain-containing protein n=1 Tax=Owenia fusiformis TaxID=6347 RepID=A0A8S4QA49_OWEFU|nr:unnamed protein product [Owenia fusiformis]
MWFARIDKCLTCYRYSVVIVDSKWLSIIVHLIVTRTSSTNYPNTGRYLTNSNGEGVHIYEEIPANRNPALNQSNGPPYQQVKQTYGQVSQKGPPTSYNSKLDRDAIAVKLPRSPSNSSQFCFRSRSKIMILALLCLAILIGGVVTGLFVSGVLGHSSQEGNPKDEGPSTPMGYSPTKVKSTTIGYFSTSRPSATTDASAVEEPSTTIGYSSTIGKSATGRQSTAIGSSSTNGPSEAITEAFTTIDRSPSKEPQMTTLGHSTTDVQSTEAGPPTTIESSSAVPSSKSEISFSTSPSSVSALITTTSSTIDHDSTTVPQPALVTYGIWTSWSPWSHCSSTCGNGAQNRTRECKKSSHTDLECSGSTEDTRECNLGNCPNCSMECSEGLIQNDCLACHCAFNQPKSFRIYNSKMTPLEEATVTRLEVGYAIIATTGKNGSVTVENTCIGDLYVIRKEHYVDSMVEITSEMTYQVIMPAIGRVNMRIHPQDAVALIGDDVTLSCLASSIASALTYRWFKDEIPIPITDTNNTLVIRNVGAQDGGLYNCQAQTESSVATSRSALVRVKENASDFCDHQPIEHNKVLPKDCPQSESFNYNVGQCESNACVGEKTETASDFCCGPIKQESRQISCNGYSLDISVVIECGCIVCNKVNTTNGLITKVREVTFSGKVYDMSNTDNLFRFGDVYLYDEKMTTTGFTGHFSFKIPSGTNRVVLTFKNDFYKLFITTTKVFNIPSDFSGNFYKDVPLMPKSKATVWRLSSKDDNLIPLANSSMENRPLADVFIPANAFYTENGDEYNGIVEVDAIFVDPRDPTSFENMVGDLTYVDNDGEVGALQSFGMFYLDIKDDLGNPLGIQSEVEIAIDLDFIGAQNGHTNVKLWSMNPISGRWEFESNLNKATTSYKHKRQVFQSSYDTNFFIGNIVINDRYWINFDNDELNYCFVKVKTFTDGTFGMELPWDEKTETTVIAVDSTRTDRWAQVTTGSMSLDSATGVATTGDCILTMCGSDSFSGYVMLNHPKGPFKAKPDIGGIAPVNAIVDVSTTSLGDGPNEENYDRVINTTMKPLTNNYGPIYHFEEGECWDKNSAFCRACRKDKLKQGCEPCGQKCRYPATKALQYCTSDINSAYYVFYQETALYEFTVCESFQQCDQTPHLVWYPRNHVEVWAWYIKIKVEFEYESVVRAVSEGGTHPETLGHIYGIREATTRDKTTCLEFKGSGDIYVVPAGSDETLVNIDVQGADCQIKNIFSDLQIHQVNPSPGIFGFKLPVGYTTSGDLTGIYFSTSSGEVSDASREAKARCECADILHGSPTCNDYKPDEGVGLTISCKASTAP